MTSRTSTVLASSNTSRRGNGKSVIGRSIPAAIPSFRAHWMAVLLTRAAVPNATIAIVAPSSMYDSARTSLLRIRSYLSCSFQLCTSMALSFRWRDFTFRRSRPAQPVSAQGFSTVDAGSYGVATNGSFIWPTMASPRIRAGLRYLSARSKASMVRAYISWTEWGASTISRYPPWPPPFTAWK